MHQSGLLVDRDKLSAKCRVFSFSFEMANAPKDNTGANKFSAQIDATEGISNERSGNHHEYNVT